MGGANGHALIHALARVTVEMVVDQSLIEVEGNVVVSWAFFVHLWKVSFRLGLNHCMQETLWLLY